MSSRCMAAVFERYPAGGGEYALALALADNAHDDGTHIYPGLATMAHKSRQDERSVQRHLRAMLARHWLLLVKASVRGHFAEYRINPRWLKGDNLSSHSEPEPRQQQDDSLSSQLPEQDDKLSCHSATNGTTNDAQWDDKSSTPYITGRTIYPPTPLAGGARVESKKPGTPGFDTIAAGYPRRDGIDAARRDWDRLAPDPQLQAEIARAIQAWIPSARWRADDGRWIPKFGRFLRDKRWLDAPVTAAPSPHPVIVPIREPALTPEQLKANGARARALVAQAKAARGLRRTMEMAA